MFQHRRRCQYCIAPGPVGCGASLERCSVHAAAPESRTMSRFRAHGNASLEEPLLLRIFTSVLNVLLGFAEGRRPRKPPFFPSSVESWNPVRGGGTRALCFGHTFPTVLAARGGFKRCHFHSGRRVSTEFPSANLSWQRGVGSDRPAVILFLHMASPVKRSLRIPARARRSTCDWPVCCRRSCQPPTQC